VSQRTALRGGSVAALLLALALALAACAGAPPVAPSGTPAVTVQLAADDLEFDRDRLSVPAGVPFAIAFENRESPPHNVTIRGEQPLFVGETFSGPDQRTYLVPSLPAGEYVFLCDVHPEMRGTVVSQ